MSETNKRFKPVTTAKTSFKILELLQERDGAGVTEIATELELAKSTVYRHLATLLEMEYVAKEGDQYRLGFRFLDLGEYVKGHRDAYRMAEEKVAELAERTEERAQFIVEEHGRAVFVSRETGRHAVRTDPGIGKRVPIHATASGKAILAKLPEPKVERIVESRGLERLTAHTITDRDELFESLERIGERGYSVNREENIKGLNAVGVPVLGQEDRVIGALSVSGPTKRLKGEWFTDELPELLNGIANELELNITHA